MKQTGHRRRIAARAAALGVGLLLIGAAELTSCSNGDSTTTCAASSDCQTGYACVDGRCGCASDAVCQPGQFCNAEGSCQTSVGCMTTADCPQNEFCDTTTSSCIDDSQCTMDVQCALGNICDTVQYKCVAGCHDPGDCPIGDVCQCEDGSTDCDPMQCVSGPCLDDSYCQFGQLCEMEGDAGPSACETDTRGPFCQACQINPGSVNDSCPGTGTTPSPNFCLLDTTSTTAEDYCGVDCSQGQTCPWGFECDDILVLTSQVCGANTGGTCQPSTPPICNSNTPGAGTTCQYGTCDIATGSCRCGGNSDCPSGGTCDAATGECSGTCQFPQEASTEGYCTCVYDTDCPTNTCVSGQCTETLTLCDANDPCQPVFCKSSTDPLSNVTIGYCKVGQNCAPEDGVACSEVRSLQGN